MKTTILLLAKVNNYLLRTQWLKLRLEQSLHHPPLLAVHLQPPSQRSPLTPVEEHLCLATTTVSA